MQTIKNDAAHCVAGQPSPDAVLVPLCGEFVQVMRAKDELMETAPASPEAPAVSDRARELLDDLLVQRATTPEGHKAQMEALAALGRPQMDYDRLIAEAPDWFGQVAAAILRDQAQIMHAGPTQSPVSVSTAMSGPYEVAQRIRRAQRLKDQRMDAAEVLTGPGEIVNQRRSALDAAAAESVELALHDMLPLLPSGTLADAAVQVFTALETLRAVDLEPVGGTVPLYRSENVTRVVRCLSSALPVLMKASERDLSEVVDAVTLQMPEQEHGLFEQLWQGAEVTA
ncbi:MULTISPECIES: hypothetical protein [Gluconobacter]|uniref:Uncharacterized protein n=1 Tax=Gluconobacter cadivus TaxID=2728101 RepID=A0ABR9YQX8_9PROT|nr:MULTISPECIES: hypothetical protein [Gluconobacter]MBF0886932.1 hypothetical protein [Gluconobacter cadivus]MBS1059001.1 hypothetical protein [Gluconobacter sp. Dm-44]